MIKYFKSKDRQKGLMSLEPFIIMILFIFVMVLTNNGIVSVIQQSWISAADSAAFAGAGKLLEEEGNENAIEDAIDEAYTFALMHTWLGREIEADQVTVTVGQWINRTFCSLGEGDDPTAVKVDISLPLDNEGNLTGITALFGRFDLPMFSVLPNPVTSYAGIRDDKVYLIENRDSECEN